MVNIQGLDKAEVLAALYNASKVQGLGFLQARPGNMTVEHARELLEDSTYFDYLYGRVMKIDLTSDKHFDERFYDRDNGPGAAQRVVDKLWLALVEREA